MSRRNRDMCSGPMLGNIILYTIPIILTSVIQLLFNTADLVVVGRFCGSLSVGAVGATGSPTTLIFSLFLGLSTGAGATTAQAIGAGDYDKTSRAVHTTIPTAVLATFCPAGGAAIYCMARGSCPAGSGKFPAVKL